MREEGRVSKEVDAMLKGETVERVERETLERTRREWIDNMFALMAVRFPDKDLPADLRQRLERYSYDGLRAVMMRISTARSVTDALNVGPGIASR